MNDPELNRWESFMNSVQEGSQAGIPGGLPPDPEEKQIPFEWREEGWQAVAPSAYNPAVKLVNLKVEGAGDERVLQVGDRVVPEPWDAVVLVLQAAREDFGKLQDQVARLRETLLEVRREAGHRGGS